MSKGAEGRWREEMGMRRTFSTYGAKMRQANREAVATVIALAVIVAVWLVGGIGLAGCGIECSRRRCGSSEAQSVHGSRAIVWRRRACPLRLRGFSLDDDAEL